MPETDQAVWTAVSPVYLRQTVSGQAPKQSTWIKTAWNEREFRVLFHCEDAHPWATLTERDGPLYNEEVVEVFVDPVGDLESYFEIEVNPLNAVCDLVIRRTRSGLRKDFGWDCEGMRTSVEIGDGWWTAELAIPFTSLTAEPPKAGDLWRINFYRIDRPEGEPWELSAWSPTGMPKFHVSERFGELRFCAM